MNPALRSSAAHVFVVSLDAPELQPDDAHHLFRVLRLRDGETVTASDGAGSWRLTQVAGQSLVVSGEIVSEPTRRTVTIASAIPKGDRAEWMVQKLTEIGVDEIVLLHCDRSVVRWDGDRATRPLARLQRVAREAAMQSRRVRLPLVTGPQTCLSVLARPGVVVAEPGGEPMAALPTSPSVVVIGPEGGFSAAELNTGAPMIRLGDTVLRVETAAIVAAVAFLT
ncbi:MAG: RsmE family RNA methyltransferase [Ilumatobacteraceae bacterium]